MLMTLLTMVSAVSNFDRAVWRARTASDMEDDPRIERTDSEVNLVDRGSKDDPRPVQLNPPTNFTAQVLEDGQGSLMAQHASKPGESEQQTLIDGYVESHGGREKMTWVAEIVHEGGHVRIPVTPATELVWIRTTGAASG